MIDAESVLSFTARASLLALLPPVSSLHLGPVNSANLLADPQQCSALRKGGHVRLPAKVDFPAWLTLRYGLGRHQGQTLQNH